MLPALRRVIHVSMVLFALTIGRWGPLWVSLSALAALLLNLFILPSLTNRTLDKPESQRFWRDPGLISYPLSVLILSLIFWESQVYMAIGWGAMAFGDPAAQYVGKKWGSRKLRWNPEKSWIGMLAFWVVATIATWVLIAFLPEKIYPNGILLQDWGLPLLVIMAGAALSESLRGSLNDNLFVPIVTGCLAWVWFNSVALNDILIPDDWLLAVIAIGVFMLLSWFSGKIDMPGTFMGGFLAVLIFAGGNWAGLGCLLLLFVLGTLASVLGRKQKQLLGVAQEAGGKRSVRHAFSNAGVAGLLGALSLAVPEWQEACMFGIVASLATATSDTFSSEFGSLYGKKFVSVITWKPGVRGQDGLISVEGTLAGVVGAGLIAIPFLLVSGNSWNWLGMILLAAMVGNLMDSMLGATFQRWEFMTNDSVNFAATLTGAISMILMLYFPG